MEEGPSVSVMTAEAIKPSWRRYKTYAPTSVRKESHYAPTPDPVAASTRLARGALGLRVATADSRLLLAVPDTKKIDRRKSQGQTPRQKTKKTNRMACIADKKGSPGDPPRPSRENLPSARNRSYPPTHIKTSDLASTPLCKLDSLAGTQRLFRPGVHPNNRNTSAKQSFNENTKKTTCRVFAVRPSPTPNLFPLWLGRVWRVDGSKCKKYKLARYQIQNFPTLTNPRRPHEGWLPHPPSLWEDTP